MEAAYARHWLSAQPDRVAFVGLGAGGDFAAVPPRTVQAMLGALEELWAGAGPPSALARAKRRAARIGAMAQAALLAGLGRGALHRVVRTAQQPCVLLSVSHRSLERREPIARLRRAGVAFVPLVHDLIPATYPEYGRPGDAGRHLRRLATVASLADGVIVNSAATEAALRPHLIRPGGPPPVTVAPLGLKPAPAALPGASAPPPLPEVRSEPSYFVTIGTIEPRKNHLLLLHIWRDFAARLGPDAPRLLLIGRRGWENENVLDLLDRCTALRGLVEEVGQVTDLTVMRLLRGARALLFPSFAEGYGLPLAEALALGTPALVSDIPALREVGGTVRDYLDPLDGPGWARAILDYADPRSVARAAQKERLRHWRTPSWADHFARVQDFLARIVASRGGAPAVATAARGDEIAWLGGGGGRLRPAARAAAATATAAAPVPVAVAAGDAGVR